MYYILSMLIVYLFIILLSSRVTIVFSFTVFVIPLNIITFLLINKTESTFLNIIWYIIASILIVMFFWITKKIRYNFTGRVLSFKLIYNYLFYNKFTPNSYKRTIGRVLPYNRYQLRYNGSMITSDEISTAGSTLISGSSGSGKTYGILSYIRENIAQKDSIIFVDYKGDPKIINDLEEYAYNNNYDIYKLSKGESNFNYDPLKNLNNSGRIEAIINMRKWSLDGSDAHYRTSTQLLLQKTIGDFSHKFKDVLKKNRNASYTLEYYIYMKKYNPLREEYDAYATVSKLMELLITSSLQDMFTFRNEKVLDLGVMKNKKFILIISFVSSNKELATSFSSMLFRDLLDEYTNGAPRKNLFLYIDEFGTLENPFIIKDILEKGRSAKIATTISLQDINQIIIQTNEAYLNSILGTINTFIVYSGATRTTAEKFAGVQLADIETVLMNLRKPTGGRTPTAIYISKYPVLNKNITSEVFRFQPYIFDEDLKQSRNKTPLSLDIIKTSLQKTNTEKDSHVSLNQNETNIHQNKKVDNQASNNSVEEKSIEDTNKDFESLIFGNIDKE